MKKIVRNTVSAALCCAMAMSITACGGNSSTTKTTTNAATTTVSSDSNTTTTAETTTASEITKPDSIRIVVNGTILQEGISELANQLSELVGVEYIFDQQDHSGYTDAVGRVLASGDWPDVILLPAGLYSTYATTGALWDMTAAYEVWKEELGDRLISDVNDGLKINGALYGFAPTRGNGCVTYVKQAWLDAVGIQPPTN